MATILTLKSEIAANLGLASLAPLTANGVDLALAALNRVRLNAELNHDFNFQRKMLTLNVDSITGGSLDNAVIYGTATVPDIKTILDIGQLDDAGNFRVAEWTTVEESLERQRGEMRYEPLWRSDGEGELSCGNRRVVISGNSVLLYPKSQTSQTVALALEVYAFSSDWTANSNTVALSGSTGATGANTTFFRFGQYNGKSLFLSVDPAAGNPTTIYAIWYDTTSWRITLANDIGGVGTDYFDLTSTSQSPAGTYSNHGGWGGTAVVASADADSTSDVWTTKGYQYLLWGAVVELNKRFKFFVPRSEGNLPPPTDLMAAGLDSLLSWDVYKYEQRRRHDR